MNHLLSALSALDPSKHKPLAVMRGRRRRRGDHSRHELNRLKTTPEFGCLFIDTSYARL